jgi:hypothetical protein
MNGQILHNKIGQFLKVIIHRRRKPTATAIILLTVQPEVGPAQIIIKASIADACIKK